MPITRQRFLSLAALCAAIAPVRSNAADAAAAAGGVASPAPAGTKEHCVFQVSDDDDGKWRLTAANVLNAISACGRDGIEVEVVAYGPGVSGLLAKAAVADRIEALLKAGVPVHACQNTMHARHLTVADLLPGVGTVPSGVVEVIRRQREGWSYVRS